MRGYHKPFCLKFFQNKYLKMPPRHVVRSKIWSCYFYVKSKFVKTSNKWMSLLGNLGWLIDGYRVFQNPYAYQSKLKSQLKTKPLYYSLQNLYCWSLGSPRKKTVLLMFFSINVVGFSSRLRYGYSSFKYLYSRSQFQWFIKDHQNMVPSISISGHESLHKIILNNVFEPMQIRKSLLLL